MNLPSPENDLDALEGRLQSYYQSRFHPEAWRRIAQAHELATASHRGQTRIEGGPYVVHPIRAALVLAEELAVIDADVLSAALLHDVLEDTVMTEGVMRMFVGNAVTDLVVALTKKPKGTGELDAAEKRQYLDNIAAGPQGLRLVKLADRLDNVRSLHLVVGRPEFWDRYYQETHDEFVPLAKRTDERLHTKLATWCDDFVKYRAGVGH